MKDAQVLRLNRRWAVMADNRQWILVFADGGDWRSRKFTYDRDHLLELIREICGRVPPAALAEIRAWPARHATWFRRRSGRPTPSIEQGILGCKPKDAARAAATRRGAAGVADSPARAIRV